MQSPQRWLSVMRSAKDKKRHQSKVRLFSAPATLEIVAMDILGPVSKMKSENQNVTVLTD